VAGGFAWVALDLGSGRGPEVAEAGGGASPAVEGAEGEAAEGEASTPLSAGGLRGAGWTAFTGYAAAHDWEGAYRYAMAWRAREPEARLALSAVLQACVGLERYAEAEPYAARLVEVSPDDPGAWTFYARVLLGLDREDAALEAAARAYGLGERSTEGLWLYASCLNAAGRYAVAVEVMDLLLAQEPSAWAYASRAKALSELGRVAEAKRDLAAAAALEPDNPQALFTRGGIKLRALDDPSGVDDLERMLELGHGDALGVLGVVGPFLLERRHEPARLLAFLERWLPGARDAASLCWRIEALLELERGPEALAAAEVLLQRESPALHVLLHARALALVGRVDEALERFAMVYTQIDPRAPEGHYCLDAAERAARLALASPQGPGRLDAALRALERWLEAEPADLEALGMRIAAWMQARRYDLAVTEAERVAPLFARSDDRALRGQFAFTWGDALWRVGRVPEGLTQLTRSLELTPTGLSLLQRGIVLAQLRLDALAEVDLRCALDREPR
ncbi:MAG: hypothetical protein KDD82_13365, partial [Planctomycetes bacterium]|nr:hypothetical protein [Planctomycetota bacterium]